ncbi:MAG: protein DA1 [Myxococcales bacterium]|nr:protein DA1 [Myxococcales bacterium]
MKRTTSFLGLLGLLILTSACSGTDGPAPLPSADDLSGRMARDLGCSAYVERGANETFVVVQGKSRVVVAPTESGVAEAARTWLSAYRADLGLPEGALRVIGETRDGANLLRVVLSNGLPDGIEAQAQEVALTFDPEGRALGLVAHTPPAMSFTPVVSAATATATATNAWAKETPDGAEDAPTSGDGPTATITTRLVLVDFPGDDRPRLAHRVDSGPKSIWVDASSGEILDATDGLAPLKAEMRGWKGYSSIPFPDGEKTKLVDYETSPSGFTLSRPHEADTFWTKPKARIVVSAFRAHASNGMFLGTPVSAPSLGRMDVGHVSPAKNQEPAGVDGLGVDAMLEVARAESYFQNHLLASPSRRLRTTNGVPTFVDDPIEVIVHANHTNAADLADPKSTGRLRDDAAHVRGTTTIVVGDGQASLYEKDKNGDSTGKHPARANRSAALSTDAIAHEMTHMWLDTREVRGEADTVEEGIADVMGQLVEHELAEMKGLPSRPDRVAEDSTFTILVKERNVYKSSNQIGLRNLASPGLVGNEAGTTFEQDCLLNPSGSPVLDARGIPKLDPQRVATKDGSHECAHMNATVVGHAFYLMTLGGTNTSSQIVVRNPVGWNAAERIWLSSVAKVVMPTGYRTIVPLDYVALARHQLTAAMLHGSEVANAVGCAWEAVRVLPLGTTANVTGRVCTKAAPIDCTRRRDGIYCDEVNDYSATRCQGGRIAASPPQCPSRTQCRPQGGFVTNTATLDDRGNLRCFGWEE